MAKVCKRRGRYVLDFYDHLGNRKRKTMPAGTKKAEAEETLRTIQDRLAKGYYRPEREIPRFYELATTWLSFKKPNVRQSTWAAYDGYVRNHFDEINPLKVNRITVAVVERFISKKIGKRISITTLKKILITFGQIMQYAVRHRYIDHNPVRDAERPRGQGQAKEAAMHIMDRAQIAAFINAVENPKYKVMFALAVVAGLRQGELLGLKWDDVLWESNQIHVQRSYNNNAWYQPKSPTSNRLVDIGPHLSSILWQWSLMCPKTKPGLIFPSKSGVPLHYSNVIRRFFHPALKKAG
jgi:integrase